MKLWDTDKMHNNYDQNLGWQLNLASPGKQEIKCNNVQEGESKNGNTTNSP